MKDFEEGFTVSVDIDGKMVTVLVETNSSEPFEEKTQDYCCNSELHGDFVINPGTLDNPGWHLTSGNVPAAVVEEVGAEIEKQFPR